VYQFKEQFNKQSVIIFWLKWQNNSSISLKITCTEQIIQNEEEDISDIDDAEQHNDSFKSSPGKKIFFNFSCMFLNPNNLSKFQFELF
jgi:hypothetical protein